MVPILFKLCTNKLYFLKKTNLKVEHSIVTLVNSEILPGCHLKRNLCKAWWRLRNQRCEKKKTISPSHPWVSESHFHYSALLLPLSTGISDKFSDALQTTDRHIPCETRASKEEHSFQSLLLYSTSTRSSTSPPPTPSPSLKEWHNQVSGTHTPPSAGELNRHREEAELFAWVSAFLGSRWSCRRRRTPCWKPFAINEES